MPHAGAGAIYCTPWRVPLMLLSCAWLKCYDQIHMFPVEHSLEGQAKRFPNLLGSLGSDAAAHTAIAPRSAPASASHGHPHDERGLRTVLSTIPYGDVLASMGWHHSWCHTTRRGKPA